MGVIMRSHKVQKPIGGEVDTFTQGVRCFMINNDRGELEIRFLVNPEQFSLDNYLFVGLGNILHNHFLLHHMNVNRTTPCVIVEVTLAWDHYVITPLKQWLTKKEIEDMGKRFTIGDYLSGVYPSVNIHRLEKLQGVICAPLYI